MSGLDFGDWVGVGICSWTLVSIACAIVVIVRSKRGEPQPRLTQQEDAQLRVSLPSKLAARGELTAPQRQEALRRWRAAGA